MAVFKPIPSNPKSSDSCQMQRYDRVSMTIWWNTIQKSPTLLTDDIYVPKTVLFACFCLFDFCVW